MRLCLRRREFTRRSAARRDPSLGARRGASGWSGKRRRAKQCIRSGFLGHVGTPISERLGTAVIGSRSSEEQGTRERPASRRQ